MRLPLAVLLLVAAPLGVAAQERAAVDTLGRIVVTAARVPLDGRDAPARVTALTAADAAHAGAASVADWLDRRAPVFLRRYGPGGLASLSLRGTGAAQTLVLLDGRPLTDPQLGQTDLALLPAVLFERVEVRHGAGSALYGAGALGGVLDLRTPVASDAPTLRLTSEAGAWGQRRLGGVATARAGRFSTVLAAEGERADDDFATPDRALIGAPLVRRTGQDRRRASAYAAVRYTGTAAQAGAALHFADAERGLGGTDSVGARQWDRLARLAVDGSRLFAWGRVEAGAFFGRGVLRYASPFPSNRADALDETGRTTTAGADVQAHLTTLPGWLVTTGASGGVGYADHPSLSGGASDGFASVALHAARTEGRVLVYPSLRLDAYAPAGGARRAVLSPHLGLNVRLVEGLRLKASAGRAFRMPTLNDRFWRPGGNPDLRPERGLSADAGLAWTRGRVQAEATVFVATARDQIVWRPQPGAGFWAPENLARTRTRGLELSAEAALPLGLDVGANAALTDARDRSDPGAAAFDRQLRYVPRWTTRAWAGLDVAAVRLLGQRLRLRLDAGVRAAGRRFTTSDESQSLPAYAVLDGALGLTHETARLRLTLALALENALDAQYEVVQSYAMPPRHALLRFSLATR